MKLCTVFLMTIAASTLLAVCNSRSSSAAVILADLNAPTVQTLINLGSDGVTIGPDRFFDFTFAASAGAGPQNAAAIAVQPLTSGGYGIRFVSTWFAANGNFVANVITYKVESADLTRPIGGVNLFSDGTAPLPALGTFSTSSLTARNAGGATVGKILTTYEDGGLANPAGSGVTITAVDSTSFTPLPSLTVTDAISAASTAGGVATGSIVENTFVAVPEPMQGGGLFVLGSIAASIGLRRPDRGAKARAYHRGDARAFGSPGL